MEFCPHLRVVLGKVEEERTCAKPHRPEWELQGRLGVVVFLQMKVEIAWMQEPARVAMVCSPAIPVTSIFEHLEDWGGLQTSSSKVSRV